MDKRVIRLLHSLRPGSILDISTGKGQFIEILKKYLGSFDQITGIDPDEEALKVARSLYTAENIRFLNMVAQRLEFADSSFDMITVSKGMHHLSKLALCINEFYRVIKTGGCLIINEMYSDLSNESEKNAMMLHHFRSEIDTILGFDHFYTLSRKELAEKLPSDKFEIISIIDFQPEDRKPSEVLISEIREHIELLRSYDQYDEFRKKLPYIESRIQKFGTDTPRHLFLLARKK